MNAGEALAARAAERGARTIYRWAGRTLSGIELAERVRAFHAALAEREIARGERVLVLARDTPAFVIAFLGAMRAGLVPVPVSTLLDAKGVAFIAKDTGARIAFVDADLADAESLAAAVSGSTDVPCVLEPGNALFEGFASDARPLAFVQVDDDDLAFLLYTSGTTGEPKGAKHRHGDLVPTAEHYARDVLGFGSDDVGYSVSPLFFAYGLGNSLTFPLWLGAEAVLSPARPSPENVFAEIATGAPTVLFTVPTLYARLLAHPDAPRDLGRVRLCVSAGEALPPALFERWRKRFGLEIVDGLGSTEMLHIFLSNRPGASRPGHCGTPVDGYTVRLVDDGGEDVSVGEVGRLLAHGPSASPGYWNREAESAETMFAPGWLRTGDSGRADDDGAIALVGRTDDLFKVSGMYVAPDEIQSVLVEHPAVLEVGVVESRDADGLARPCAFVVLVDGFDGDDRLAAELREHARAHLAPYKAPRELIFRSEGLPRNANGKLQRAVLRAEIASR